MSNSSCCSIPFFPCSSFLFGSMVCRRIFALMGNRGWIFLHKVWCIYHVVVNVDDALQNGVPTCISGVECMCVCVMFESSFINSVSDVSFSHSLSLSLSLSLSFSVCVFVCQIYRIFSSFQRCILIPNWMISCVVYKCEVFYSEHL